MNTNSEHTPHVARRLIPRGLLNHLLFLVLLPIFFSCAGNLPGRFPAPVTDNATIIAGIDAVEDRLVTSRRIFDFTIRRGIFSARGEGVFLFSRPGLARIDLYLGSVELVFQYYHANGVSSVILPAEGRLIRGRDGLITVSGIEDLDEMQVRDSELITTMLGLCEIDDAFERISEVREGKEGYLLVIERDSETAFVHIDPVTYLPREYEVLSSGKVEREIVFSSYRVVQGLERPRSVIYRDHRNDIEIRLSVRSEAVNEEIRPELFELPRGWGGID